MAVTGIVGDCGRYAIRRPLLNAQINRSIFKRSIINHPLIIDPRVFVMLIVNVQQWEVH